jgi:hypothetical protein
MIAELLVWLAVVSVAFVAWSLYATADGANTAEEREPLRPDE